MQSTYAALEMLIEETPSRPRTGVGHPTSSDRAQSMPMLGIIIGTGVSLVLWTVIGCSAWLMLA